MIAQAQLGMIGLIIVIVYLAGIMLVGILAGYRKNTTSEQFFLAGKSLRWPMIGAALFTANISTIHLVGLSASGFNEGIVVGNFEWMAAICLIILGLIFVPFYVRTAINTLPEFLERRYNPACRMIMALIAIWSALLVHIGVSLYAGATIFEYFFGIEPIYSIIIIAVVTAIYTITGGLKAIVVTDTIQAVLLLGGCILLTIFGISRLPEAGIDSFAAFKAAVKPDQMSMVHSLRDANGNLNGYSWLTVMIGYHVLGIWYWCTDQTIVQKTLGAKSLRDGQLGAIFAGVLKILPLFFMVLPGVIAYVLFKDRITESNQTLTFMIDKLLPNSLLKGLFSAGLLAAVMSTVEAALNSTATVTAEDLCKHLWPGLKDRTLVLIGRVTAGIVIVLAMLWSPYCGRFASIFVVVNKVPMMFAPAITTVFVLGVFWKRGTKQAGLATFIVGVVVGFTYFIVDLPHNVNANKVLPAIQSKRVSEDSVVEQWTAIARTEMSGSLSTRIPAEKVFSDWDAIPLTVSKAVIEENQWDKEEDAEQRVADGYVAIPSRLLSSDIDGQLLSAGAIVRTMGSVPENELTAALTVGSLPGSWLVLNYEYIAHGVGIPFMLMGLVLLSVCVVVYVVASLMTQAPTVEELEKMGWQPPLKAITQNKITGLTDPRVMAMGLFVLMIVLYWILR